LQVSAFEVAGLVFDAGDAELVGSQAGAGSGSWYLYALVVSAFEPELFKEFARSSYCGAFVCSRSWNAFALVPDAGEMRCVGVRSQQQVALVFFGVYAECLSDNVGVVFNASSEKRG
jgi:hypothetical protein